MTLEEEAKQRDGLEEEAAAAVILALLLIDRQLAATLGQTVTQAQVVQAQEYLFAARLIGWEWIKNNAYDAKVGQTVFDANDAATWAADNVAYMAEGSRKIIEDALVGLDGKTSDAEKKKIAETVLKSRQDNRVTAYADDAVNGAVELGKYLVVGSFFLANNEKINKTWHNVGDNKVRQTHIKADGQTVGFTEKFKVGGYEMRFPRDNIAQAKETARCRCSAVYSKKWSK
jgi:hypothetical protein